MGSLIITWTILPGPWAATPRTTHWCWSKRWCRRRWQRCRGGKNGASIWKSSRSWKEKNVNLQKIFFTRLKQGSSSFRLDSTRQLLISKWCFVVAAKFFLCKSSSNFWGLLEALCLVLVRANRTERREPLERPKKCWFFRFKRVSRRRLLPSSSSSPMLFSTLATSMTDDRDDICASLCHGVVRCQKLFSPLSPARGRLTFDLLQKCRYFDLVGLYC